MERRKSTRFRLRCEVTCAWRDEQGQSRTLTAFTHDISAGGLFISCQQWPWAGAFTVLNIELPSREEHAHIQLHGSGRVIRTGHNGSGSGFAVAGTPGWTISRTRKLDTVNASK